MLHDSENPALSSTALGLLTMLPSAIVVPALTLPAGRPVIVTAGATAATATVCVAATLVNP